MGKRMELEDIKNLLLFAPLDELETQIEYIHPADILDIIGEDEEESHHILKRLPESLIAEIIDEAEDEDKYAILKRFSDHQQKNILGEMSSDEITNMITALEDEEDAKEVLELIPEEERHDVEQLLTYSPDTAGGIMATEFIAIFDTQTVQKTYEYLQSVAADAETAYYLYVVDKSTFILKGVVSLRDMVSSSFDTPILDITNPNVITIPYDMDQEEVAKIFSKYGFLIMPVVDEQNHMLGIITIDDIMDIIEEETTEDIHHMGGIAKEERVDGTLQDSLKSRLPWLLVNLLTAILAASVVGFFESTIAKVVSLATVMPIVTGMGGNAGTQSLTIIVRGLALGEIDKENGKKIFLKEFGVGIITGIVIGAIIAVGGMLFEGKIIFGVVTGVAMVLNMIMATISGYIVPIILKHFKVDPALASAVFVTTVTDVLGFFFFLGLATIFLPYLL